MSLCGTQPRALELEALASHPTAPKHAKPTLRQTSVTTRIAAL
jgi:hypothetical protein